MSHTHTPAVLHAVCCLPQLCNSLPSPNHKLKRDFTYVEDIVSGVLAAMDYTPTRCGEAYNLGYGQPLVVESMLEYLQKELGKKALIVSYLIMLHSATLSTTSFRPLQDRQPLPPSDMYITFADISTSQRVLGFQPKTSTAEGVYWGAGVCVCVTYCLVYGAVL